MFTQAADGRLILLLFLGIVGQADSLELVGHILSGLNRRVFGGDLLVGLLVCEEEKRQSRIGQEGN